MKWLRAGSPARLSLVVSLWLALAGNLAFWRTVWALPELAGARGLVFALGMAAWITAACALLLNLAAWPRVLKPVAGLLLLSAASASYFMLQYGVVIDATMMANVANTDAREVRDLLSWQLLVILLGLGLLPIVWLLRQRLDWPRWTVQARRNLAGAALALLALVALTLASYQDLASLMRNHKQVRYLVNPLNSLYGSGKLVADQLPRAARTLQPVGQDARLGPGYAGQARAPLLIVVVGETARAANFSLGGYERPTNPELGALMPQGALTWYGKVSSCGTNTQVSVPCMFSPLGKAGYESARQPYENLLDVLQRAGLAVLWIDNQSGCKGVCERVPNVATASLSTPELCTDGECFDAILRRSLDAQIAQLDAQRRARGIVVVLHQMGSHGPAYHRRSPADRKPFQPECRSNVLQDCPREQVRNAYDNTIAYTDHVLADLALWLDAKARGGPFDTAMLYVSDHGESLGENNLYLHGLPYAIAPEFQTHVPMLSWISPAMRQRRGIRMDCLKANADAPLSHDNLFHTVLGLMDVQTAAYRQPLDWIAACR